MITETLSTLQRERLQIHCNPLLHSIYWQYQSERISGEENLIDSQINRRDIGDINVERVEEVDGGRAMNDCNMMSEKEEIKFLKPTRHRI